MDPRGSITKWIQSDGSTLFAAREYDAFGRIIPGSTSGSWPGRTGYQGQTCQELLSGDGSQRVILTPTRILDPLTGRFLQNEGLLERRPSSHYLYVEQNPINGVDPTGFQTCPIAEPSDELSGDCALPQDGEFDDDGPAVGIRKPAADDEASNAVRNALLSELEFTKKQLQEADAWWRWGGSPEIDRYNRRIAEINTLLQDPKYNGQIARLPNQVEYAPESGSAWDSDPGAVGLLPVVGSGIEAYYHFRQGNVGRGILYSALAVSDLFLVGSVVKSFGKLGLKVISPGAASLLKQRLGSHVAWEVNNKVYHAAGVWFSMIIEKVKTFEQAERMLAGYHRTRLWVLSRTLMRQTGGRTSFCVTGRLNAINKGYLYLPGWVASHAGVGVAKHLADLDFTDEDVPETWGP